MKTRSARFLLPFLLLMITWSSATSLYPPTMLSQAASQEQRQSLAATMSFKAFGDTELRQATADSNLGDEVSLMIGSDGGQFHRVFLEIPVWDLPRGATINRAMLNIKVNGWADYPGQLRTITARRVESIWHEHLATWNNAPAASEAVGSVAVSTTTDGWYAIDVTNLVRAWYDGSAINYGIMLTGPEFAGTAYRTIASTETVAAPRLEINLTTAATTLTDRVSLYLPLILKDSAGQTTVIPIATTTSTATSTPTHTPTDTPLATATATDTPTATNTPTDTPLVIATATNTPTATNTATNTPTSTATNTQTATNTATNTQTATNTATNTQTATNTATNTPTPTVPPAKLPNAVALVIGIADYQYLGSAQTRGSRAGDWGYDLAYAENDPKGSAQIISTFDSDFGAALLASNPTFRPCVWYAGNGRHQQTTAADILSGRVDDSDCNMLTLVGNQATVTQIRQAFQWLDERENAESQIMIFYSGHGGQISDDNGDESDTIDEFITAYDTRDTATTYENIIRDDELDQMLTALESSQITLFIDSCFSGGMPSLAATDESATLALPRGIRPASGTPAPLATQPQSGGVLTEVTRPGRILLTASQDTQTSWEFGELHHGVFSYYLFMGLLDPATDTNTDGWISAEEVYTALAPRVDSLVFQRTSQHQNPQIYDGIVGEMRLTRAPLLP